MTESALFYGRPPAINNGMGTPVQSISAVHSSIPDYSSSNWYSPNTLPRSLPDFHATEVSQKLDRVLGMLDDQKKEIKSIMDDSISLKKEVELLKERSLSASGAVKKAKLPTGLSAAVKRLQEKSPSNLTFDGSQEFNSTRNEAVKNYLIENLEQHYSPHTYTPKKIKRAVHRYYESRRRLYNDSRPTRKQKAESVKYLCKQRERRKKLYKTRSKHLKHAAEEEMWAQLSWEYMTEESEADDDIITTHSISFRSDCLNKLIKKCDKRISAKKTTKHGFVRKERKAGIPSKQEIPENAPLWAIKQVMITTPKVTTVQHRSQECEITASAKISDPISTIDTSAKHSDTPKASRNGRSAQRKLILDDMHMDLSDSSSTSDVDSE